MALLLLKLRLVALHEYSLYSCDCIDTFFITSIIQLNSAHVLHYNVHAIQCAVYVL